MNFHEGASRIPIIVHAPGRFTARRVKAAVSLLDVLPTLAAIAGEGREPEYATTPDGRSLLPYCEGAPDDAGVAGFCEEIARRWNLETLRQDVLASQKRRRLVSDALNQGQYHPWD